MEYLVCLYISRLYLPVTLRGLDKKGNIKWNINYVKLSVQIQIIKIHQVFYCQWNDSRLSYI